MKTLIVLAKRPVADLAAQVVRGEHPRVEYLEHQSRVAADIVDYHSVDASRSPWVRVLRRRLGDRWALAALAFSRAHDYDNFYATGEDVGLPLALLLRTRGLHDRLTMVVHNADTPKRRHVLRAIGHDVFKQVIALCSAQAELLARTLGFSQHKVHFLPNWVDPRFYAPACDAPGDYALSVGMEKRDYPTLCDAVRSLSLRVHVVGSGFSAGAGFTPASGLREQDGLTTGSGYSARGLRELYDRARLVVLPVRPCGYAAGVTSLLEGMCMGKTVVVSETPGLRDYVQPGVSALLYRPGDPEDLRRVLNTAWRDEAGLRSIGAHGRRWVEAEASTERYVEAVARLLGH